ncbi:hypothetical protein SAMN05444166_5403 [Singulisphaera sp. GP187]|uniref:hypothetical protein n=1 Tax=Singulisphaera sp. GP187 TaxID=1882752 RepID=UPI00092B1909|nr:hypothetical protein [Singulisphaera sp. GP187]SIO57437.1 hypothetical protein SAMN05444166_5403 [Singulisphaera sp. GP187]
MSSPNPRSWLATLLLILILVVPLTFLGCGPEGSGTIDLKKKADLSPSGGSKSREFRPGDLEER